MNQRDKDFLHSIMLERMTVHYAAHHKGISQSVIDLNKQVGDLLTRLPEEQSKLLHEYFEHNNEVSAQYEQLYYRCGLLDGLKLYDYIRNVKKN